MPDFRKIPLPLSLDFICWPSLLGRWIGTGLMVKFRPQDMLLVYALMNILLCGVVMLWGGMIGLYAMLAISFFMSIMYPTQFSLALKGLG